MIEKRTLQNIDKLQNLQFKRQKLAIISLNAYYMCFGGNLIVEFLSATGQVMFAVFLAGSQFLEPLNTDYVTKIEERREVQPWEYEVFKFSPLNINELRQLSNDNLARYIKLSCIGMLNQTINDEDRENGGHFLALDNFGQLILNLVDPAEILRKQEELIEPKEEFVFSESFEFMIRACDTSFPIETLTTFNLSLAVEKYAEFYNEVPNWRTADDLPDLPEVSFVRDLENNIIGDFNKIETIVLDGKREILRFNRRTVSEEIPIELKHAIVSIEDMDFWNFKPEGSEDYKGHKGVQIKSFFRAGQTTVSSDQTQGGSTLTMQLAKNLILYKDVFIEQKKGKRSFFRKVRELILSKRLEELLTKDEILELYLHTIDFGRRSQGVEMASINYFGKTINELELHEIALIAALPKGPYYYNPSNKREHVKKRVKDRRDYVLTRMNEGGYISKEQMENAQRKPVSVIKGSEKTEQSNYAHYYISQVKNELSKKGDITEGFDVVVPIHHKLQRMAVDGLQKGLLDYERKHKTLTVKTYEDFLPNIKKQVEAIGEDRQSENLIQFIPEVLEEISLQVPDVDQFELGVILSNNEIGLADGSIVPRHANDKNGILFKIEEKGGDKKNLEVWDTVFIQKIVEANDSITYRIASMTDVTGGVVILDVETGDVLATSGGYSIGAGARDKGTNANRAFNAERQPGSTVKPFTYLYALQAGLTPESVVSNRRTSFPTRRADDGERLCGAWNPNSSKIKANELSLANALAHSQNYATMNVMAAAAGLRPVVSQNSGRLIYPNGDAGLSEGLENVHLLMERFGVYEERSVENYRVCHPSILGTKDTTAARLGSAYGAIARGGEYIKPKLINAVLRNEEVLSNQREESQDINISLLLDNLEVSRRLPEDTKTLRRMLQGALKKGTAKDLEKWSSLIAGKTGTTNSSKDAWFVGFNKKIVVAVWVGYPQKRDLAPRSYGGNTAMPIFKYIMEDFYSSYPEELNNTFDGVNSAQSVASNTNSVSAGEFLLEPSSGFLLNDKLIQDYKSMTGRSDELPAESISETEVQRRNLGFYNGYVSDALADVFIRRLEPSRRSSLEAQQRKDLDQISRVYYSFKDRCDQSQRTNSEICVKADYHFDQYWIFDDFKRYFLIFNKKRDWETYR